VWEIFGALLYGGKLVIVPKVTAQDPEEFLKILIKHKVTVLNQIPTAFYHLSNAEARKKEHKLSVRYIIFGGEALKPAKLKEWKAIYPDVKMINMYGITETTVHSTYKEVNTELIRSNNCNIGVPIPTTTIYIFDKYKQLVPIGVKGEIYVGGDGSQGIPE
jgi:non-ribosomal peptide synthetase component F